MTARTGSGAHAGPVVERVGRYRLLRVIGEGGMGVVHLGLAADDRVAAVKVLRPHIAGDTDARARLAREVAALRRLRHARVAEIVDVDLAGPVAFVATRYIPGPPVEAVVREHGALALPALATLMWGLGEAISVIHAAGLIHRDIKPSNVLLLDGEPVVIDFGIARALDDATLTATGMLIGTPGYLAPELLAGAPPERSVDWWGWAAVSAFAATGRPPFGRGPMELSLDRIRRGDADLAGLPASLEALLRSALSPDPAHRPGPEDLRAALAGALGAPAFGPTMRYPDQPATVADVPVADPVPRPVTAAGAAAMAAPTTALRIAPTTAMPRPAQPPPQPRPQPQPPAQAPPPPASLPVMVVRRGWAGLTAAWLVALTLVALIAPVALAWLAWAWLSLARATQWTRVDQARRRWRTGGHDLSRSQTLQLVVAYPLRLIGAGAVSALWLLPWLLVTMLVVWGRDVAPDTVAATPRQIAVVSSVVLVLVAWWGPGTGAIRPGTRFLTAPVLGSVAGRWIWLGVAGLLAVAALVVLGADGISSTGWTPGWTVPSWLRRLPI